ncbi:MAG: lipopolysaccharide heptosyltransferase II [Candidatus Omnitrophica bacterium CG11_big_fil_rev_8_21_14_0_20_64_10]|nr:MAG: lipopolysaccharide heptosyltransferase II [Candidatus Omnitrophica bacterium CG11_big_fil_rev_8_21_14_0_20_64_10]
MKKSSPERILIVGVNWLGDLLFMTPAIRAIRKAHPEARLSVLVPPRGEAVLRGNPHLNEILSFPESRGLGGWIRLPALIWKLKAGRFDTAFLFHRSFSRALAVWAAGIPERIGFSTWKRRLLLNRPVPLPTAQTTHKAIGFLQLVVGAGIPADGTAYDLKPSEADRAAADRFLAENGIRPQERLVAAHAGGNWSAKRWPAERFAALADGLSERFGVRVLFTGGAGDRPLLEGIAAQTRSGPLIAAGRLSFTQTGALLTRVACFISNDSGPLHLALAVGTPVIALFGPTEPLLTGPLGGTLKRIRHPRAKVWQDRLELWDQPALQRPVVPEIFVDRIMAPALGPAGGAVSGPTQAIAATVLFGSIGCPVPCFQRRCPRNFCMEQITVDQVLAEAAARL